MQKAPARLPKSTELQQHFQNYFELLLGAERAKLQRTIAAEKNMPADRLMNEIEQRIAYLKGAVRMGALLCLITSEEAKLKHETLKCEREMLLTSCSGPRTFS